jgi:hypothetical protein
MGKPTKIYKALLTQSSTDAPTAENVQSTIGTPTFGYTSTGIYTMTLTGAFTANKTAILIAPTIGAIVSAVRTSADVITITTQAIDGDGEAVANALLTDNAISIEIAD